MHFHLVLFNKLFHITVESQYLEYMYSKHPLIRTPTPNVRIIGWILKGNSRKGIKNPFELAKVRIIGRRINGR